MCFTLNKEHFTFHLEYKHSGTFANRKYNRRFEDQVYKIILSPLESLLTYHTHIDPLRMVILKRTTEI